MAFDVNDWGAGTQEGVTLAPTEEKGGLVIDLNSPETVLEQVQKGLNTTPTKFGFHDGVQWRSYISSDGQFKFEGDGDNKIEWDGSDLTVTGRIVNKNSDVIILHGKKIATQNPLDKTAVTFVDDPRSYVYRWSEGTSSWKLSFSYGEPSPEGTTDINQTIVYSAEVSGTVIQRNSVGFKVFHIPEEASGISSGSIAEDNLVGVGSTIGATHDYYSLSSRKLTTALLGMNNSGGVGVYAYADNYNLDGTNETGVGVKVFANHHGILIRPVGANGNSITMEPKTDTGLSTINRPTWSLGEKGSFNVDADGQLWFHNGTEWKLVNLS